MRLALLTLLTLIAFASNSLLNRAAVDAGHIDPSSFALMRVVAGALVLGMILTVRKSPARLTLWSKKRVPGVLGLSVYMIGFSLAYVSLDAGLGALILFGTVQVTMFAFTALRGDRPAPLQLMGAVIAFFGLTIALWPGEGSLGTPIAGAFAMVLAGVGWAAYTLVGRGATDALAETAANFIVSAPLLSILLLTSNMHASWEGILLAILCGGLTSGVGYAMWYAVLPMMRAQTAAVLQLSVPLIALGGGALLLGEVLNARVLLATVLVISGILVTVAATRSVPAGRT